MSELTQHDKILTIMGRDTTGRWYFPYDFMKPDMGELFVGYEASARLSELAKQYPDMIESQRDGKYYKRRINFDTAHKWYSHLMPDVKRLIKLAHAPEVPVVKKPKPVDKTQPLFSLEPTKKEVNHYGG